MPASTAPGLPSVTCLQVQVPICPDDPGCVITQGHKHCLGQSFIPVPLPLDGHFPTSKSSVRFLLNLPEKGSCENNNSTHCPKIPRIIYTKSSFWVLQGWHFLSPTALLSLQLGKDPAVLRPEPLVTAHQLCGFRCHVTNISRTSFLICEMRTMSTLQGC